MSILNLTSDQTTTTEEKIISDDHVQEGVTAPVVDDSLNNNDQTDQKIVVMDGPLSRIYTEALNMSLAKEAAGAGAAASGGTDVLLTFPEDQVEAQADNASDLYVYCCDAKDIDPEAALIGSDKLRLALDNSKYKKVIMVMEGHQDIGRSAGLLEEYAFKQGIQIVFKRDVAVETIKELLK